MRIVRLIAIFSLFATLGRAEDSSKLADQILELQKTVEKQSKEIDALKADVEKLTATLQGKSAPAAPTVEGAAPAAGAAPAKEDKEEFSTANAPKAEPAQPRHVVVKGETLTSIAKHYNVPLAELMKANKGLDERKLQIGQSILLPAAASAKPSEPKPNP